jgi:hypothetical protein
MWKRRLEGDGWLVQAEVTFNRYGERGSVDLLAYHAVHRILLVIEVKVVIFELQRLLIPIDRKLRLSTAIAAQFGWRLAGAVPVLVIADTTTSRRRIASHAALLSRFALRGAEANAWLRQPDGVPLPTGLLCIARAPKARSGDRRRTGRQRIRLRTPNSRSNHDAITIESTVSNA